MHPIDGLGHPAVVLVVCALLVWVGQAMLRAGIDLHREQRRRPPTPRPERTFHWQDAPYTWPEPHAKWLWGANAQVPLPHPYRCSNCGADIQPGEVLMRWPMFDATYHQWADDPALPCGPVYPVGQAG